MTVAWIWARSELRGRWRSWVVLGLLAGATFGLAAAGWAGARRTSVALPRYVTAVHAPTAAVLANDPSFDAAERDAVAALPEVKAVYPFEVAIGLDVHPGGGGGLVPLTEATARAIGGVVIEGRAADPARADEIVVDQNLERQFGLHIGSTMTLGQAISPEDAADAPPGMVPPGVDLNFEQKLRVVGIAKSVDTEPNFAPSGGFYAKYGARLAGFVNEFTTLRRGEADLPRFQQDVNRIIGHPVNVESFAQLVGLPKVANILRVEQDGLLIFALAVLIVGGVLVGQALARAVSAGASDLATWRAIGVDRRIALRALVLPALLTVAVGVATAVAVAVALSARFPISQARRYDLDIGFHADWVVLGVEAVAVVVAVLTIALLSALWTVSGHKSSHQSPSTAGTWATRSGIVWDFIIGSGAGKIAPEALATITRDHDVKGALHALWVRDLRIDGIATPTWATNTFKGAMTPVVLDGRAPRNRDEIAFGPATFRDLKLHLGERIPVGTTAGHTATVVGKALLPASSHTDYDQSAWLTDTGLQAALPHGQQLATSEFEDYVFVKWTPNAKVSAAQRRYGQIFGGSDSEAIPVVLPVAVVSLGRLRSLLLALGVFFALLATATVAHALVTTVRRRRHELAILRSLGFTRRQSRVAIAWQSTLLAAAGVVLGVPLGIVGGRAVWRWLADSFPVVYVPPLALLAVVLVVPAAVALANLLAAGPARSAARIRPAEALRTE